MNHRRFTGPLAGLALVALSGSAHAQQFDPTFPDVYVDASSIVDTYIDGSSRWLLPGARADQVIELVPWSGLYCEETDFSFLPIDAVGKVASGTQSTSYGRGSVYGVACNYALSPSTSMPAPTRIRVPIDLRDGRDELALRQAARDQRWQAQVVLDPDNNYNEGGYEYVEVTDNTVQRTFSDAKTFAVLTGDIHFGPLTAHIVGGAGTYVLDDSMDCGGDLELRGAQLTFALGEGFAPITVDADSAFEIVCATPQMNSNGSFDLNVTGTAYPHSVALTGTFGGLTATASIGISWDGLYADALSVELPTGTTAHRPKSLKVGGTTQIVANPRGLRWLPLTELTQGPVGSLDDVAGSTHGDFFLVSRAAPVGVRVGPLTFGARGGQAPAKAAQWLRALPAHPLDSRNPAKGGPRANDVWLSNVDADGNVRLDGRGLTTTLVALPGQGVTAFPHGALKWDESPLLMEGGRFVPGALAIQTATVDQRTDCPGCGAIGGSPRVIALEPTSGNGAPGLASGGAVLARVNQLTTEVGFGPIVTGNRPTFLRAGDVGQSALWVLPGFELSGATPAHGLLGAWTPEVVRDSQGVDAFQPTTARPIDDPQVRKGNGAFAGLTIGPEIYSDTQNQPVIGWGRTLAGSTMSIAFPTGVPGQSDVKDVPANAGAKFVVAGTVTGVFNTDDKNAPQPQVYGYGFSFSRFAFGLVDNTLSKTTWIDGRVSVGGHGEFGIPFTSLGLECTGQLGGGVVDFARQTPQSLRAWKTPYDIQQIAFKPTGNDTACSTNARQLAVGGAVDVKAMAKKVSLEATWSPAGTPTGAKLGPVSARIEKVGDDPGFPVQTKADALTLGFDPNDKDAGWFLFGAKLFLPFWEAVDAELRLQNVGSAPAFEAAPSLVVPASFTPVGPWVQQWPVKSNKDLVPMFSDGSAGVSDSLTLNAKRQWVFELGGPVKWKPRTSDKLGRLVVSKDSEHEIGKIAKLKSAIPYITSTNTQYTFGMDADFTKLSTSLLPQIKIDLKDPDALANIDKFLDSAFGITSKPLETGLSAIRGAINDLSSSVKGLFGPALKNVLRAAIKKAFETLGVGDLLDLAAKAISAVQGMAQQAITAVFDPLRSFVDQAVAGILAGPDTLLVDIGRELPFVIADASQTADTAKRNAAVAAINTITVTVEKTGQIIDGASGFLTNVSAKVSDAQTALTDLRTQLNSKATTALCLLRNPAVEPIDANLGYVCGGSTPGLYNILDPSKLNILKCTTENPIIGLIDSVRNKIKSVTLALNAGAANKLQGLVDTLGKKIPGGIKTDGFIQSLGLVDGYAKLINEKVDKAYFAIVGDPAKPNEPSFCKKTMGGAGPKLASLADKARQFLETVRGTLGSAKTAVDGALVSLLSPTGPLVIFKTNIAQSKQALGQLGSAINGYAAKLKAYLDPNNLPSLQVAPGDVTKELDALANMASPLVGQPLSWCATKGCPAGSKSFLNVIGQKLATPVYDLIGAVESAVGAKLSAALALIPFPKKDELLAHITNLIVDSPVLDEVTQLVNENLSFIEDKANEIVNMVLDQLSYLLQQAVDLANSAIAAALGAIESVISGFPLSAAKIKGFTDIMGDQIMALQVDAHFDMNKKKDTDEKKSSEAKSATGFDAQLRVESWEVNGKAQSCGAGGDNKNNYDANISASNLPITIGGSDGLKISKLHLGFSIANGDPIGIFGGISTTGSLAFGEFKLKNIALEAALGLKETYIGAHAQAVFQSYNCDVAFFAGKACTFAPLKAIDPEIVRFIPEPNPPEFFGAYVHGGVQFPIIDGGCALTVGVGVEAAIWAFGHGSTATIGGLVGGSVYGQALCFVSIRGGIRIAASYVGGDDGGLVGSGEFYAGGGLGFSCDPDTWTSAAAIEADDGCATVDVSATASYTSADGVKTGPIHTSGID